MQQPQKEPVQVLLKTNLLLLLESLIPVGAVFAYGSSDAPSGWLSCLGQEVYRNDYPELFAVIGTTYGAGNGTTTFNLPDLAGRVVVGQGSGTGLTARSMGAEGGAETHTLTASEMPSHTHTVQNTVQISGFNTLTESDNSSNELDLVNSQTTTSSSAGDGDAHNNMQPFTVLNYIIRYGNKT